MNQHQMSVDDFRDLDAWRTARSVVCALLDVSAALLHAKEHSSYAHCLNSLSIAVLDNMAKGYERDERFLLEAKKAILRLEKLLAQGQLAGLLGMSEFIPLIRELRNLNQSLEITSSAF